MHYTHTSYPTVTECGQHPRFRASGIKGSYQDMIVMVWAQDLRWVAASEHETSSHNLDKYSSK